MADNSQGGTPPKQPQFALQRIYVKDLSFEAPMGYEVFQRQWQPKVQLDLNTASTKISQCGFT